MKKSLIAGAGIAALGLAVVPFAGVFAKTGDITNMTDNFTVTVNPTCTFNIESNTYAATMEVNSKLAKSGQTSMNVKCNDTKGYKVTVTSASDLALPDGTTATTGNDKIPFVTATVNAGAAGWNAYKTEGSTTTYFATTDKVTTGVSNVVMQNDKMTTTEGDKVTINYDIATSENQAQGAYTGSIVYTLTPSTTTTKQ